MDENQMEYKKERIFEINVAVDVKSKEILSIKVTADEHVHDSKALSELVDGIIKSNSMTIMGKLLADGAYDVNDIFRCISDNGIHLFIY
jgi:hypothetical protein